MTRYTIDAYAWIEYLEGSTKGITVKEIVENEKNELFTSIVTLTEVLSKFIRTDKNPQIALKAIRTLSKISYADEDLALLIAEIHAEMKKKASDFGLADAFVIATAKKNQTKIVTGDEKHFRTVANTITI